MSDISGESNMEKYRMWCKENMAKKVLEKTPNTFSILYRSGSIEKKSEPLIPEADNAQDIEIPDMYFTGKFTEDISDYFKNRLIEGGVNITDDISIRTSPLSWYIYFEVYYGLVQIETSSISTNDLFNNNREDYIEPCEMKIIENIPMCLFDKFNIINYPEWGEVVMFNYDKLKSEILDKYAITGSKDIMEKSYSDLLNIMDKFPNTYNILSERIIDLIAKKPVEITMEEDRILNLRNTEIFKRLLEEKRGIEENKPDPDEEHGRRVKGVNHDNWQTRYNEWVTTYKSWFSNIEQDYKLCFKACYEKMLTRDFQFPGFILYTNISGNTIMFK